MTGKTLLNIENLYAGYGGCAVLQDICAQANAGEIIGLLGPNGSGKTTLIKSLLGITPAMDGRVRLIGKNVSTLKPRERARKIAYLAQRRETAWPMTARKVVALGRAPYRGALGKISAEGERAIDAALEMTGSMEFADRDVTTLSGGEQARILLARALAVKAPVLLADEPVAALDPYYQIAMMDVLRRAAKDGALIIVALHDLSLASTYCDKLWVLHHGKLVADAKPEEALSDAVLKTVFRVRRPESGFQPALNIES